MQAPIGMQQRGRSGYAACLRGDFRERRDAYGDELWKAPQAVNGRVNATVVHLKEQGRVRRRPDIGGNCVDRAAIAEPCDVYCGLRGQQLVQLWGRC